MNKQNVLIISHRRSGTHLTIDSIRNNFKALRKSPYVTLETLDRGHPDHLDVSEFRQAISDHQCVIKVHYLPNVSKHLESREGACAEEVFSQSKQIYVVRNGLDVLASLYEFRRGHDLVNLSESLRSTARLEPSTRSPTGRITWSRG